MSRISAADPPRRGPLVRAASTTDRASHILARAFVVVLCLAFFFPSTLRAAPPTGVYRRFAVIGTPALQKMGLTDLISIELQQKGVTLVEREQLDAIAKEQSLNLALAPDGSATRIRVGQLAKADALILLSEEGDKSQRLRVIVAECKQGARLSSNVFSLEKPGPELARKVADAVEQTRRRFAGGIKQMIGVPAFISRNFTYEYHPLQVGYATLLQEALGEQPGVAVIEVEEAHAIRKELDIASGKAIGIVPTFVEGEYEVTTDAKKRPLVQFKILLRTASAVRTIERKDLTLAEASRFISRDVPAEALPHTRVAPAEPFTPEKEFAKLVARADAFAALGEWKHALQLRQAALVIDPDSEKQRETLVDECALHLRAAGSNGSLSLPRPDHEAIVAALIPVWRAEMESIEWEIRHKGPAIRPNRPGEALISGLFLTSQSTYASEARTLNHYFLVNLFPLIWDPRWDDPRFKPRFDPRFFWVEHLIRSATFKIDGPLDAEDLNVLLRLLNGPVPPTLQPSRHLEELCWGQFAPRRRDSEAFIEFLRKLERSDRPVNQVVAQVALISCKVHHGAPVDREMLDQIEKVRAQYLAIELVKDSTFPSQIMTELDRLRDLSKPPIPVLTKDAPDQIDAGALHLTRVPLIQKLAGGGTIDARQIPSGLLTGLVNILRCGNSVDVVWDSGAFNLMHEPGVLERLWDLYPGGGIGDVAWDGTHIWLATLHEGIWELDTSGKILSRFTGADGLPPCDAGLRLTVLAPNRLMILGSMRPASRVFLATLSKEGATFNLNVFLKATRVLEPKEISTAPMDGGIDLAFLPQGMGTVRTRDGSRNLVWVSRFAAGVKHFMMIDPVNLSVFVPNSLQSMRVHESGGWILQSHESGGVDLWRANPIGEPALISTIPISGIRMISWLPLGTPDDLNGYIYLLRSSWIRLDPRSMTACRLAPNGPVGGFTPHSAGLSRHGILVWGKYADKGCMYRLSIDEEKVKALPKSDWFQGTAADGPATRPSK